MRISSSFEAPLRHFRCGPGLTVLTCGLVAVIHPDDYRSQELRAALSLALSNAKVTETCFSSFSLSRKARREVRALGAHAISVEEKKKNFFFFFLNSRKKLGTGQTCQKQ